MKLPFFAIRVAESAIDYQRTDEDDDPNRIDLNLMVSSDRSE